MTDDRNTTDFMLAWIRRLGRLTVKARRETARGNGHFRLILTFASLTDLLAAEVEFGALAAMAEEDAAAMAQDGRPEST